MIETSELSQDTAANITKMIKASQHDNIAPSNDIDCFVFDGELVEERATVGVRQLNTKRY